MTTDLLNQAFRLHQAGDADRAEALYRQVLASTEDSFDATHLLGVALSQRGAHAEGISWLRRAIALDPTQPQARASLASALLAVRDSSAAVAVCDELLKLEPQNSDAWMLRGNALQQAAAHEQAIDSFAQTLRLKHDLPAAWNNAGHSLRILRKFSAALSAFRQALTLQPSYVMALNNQGLTFLDLQLPSDALRSFDEALAVEPNSIEALMNKGTVLLALKRFDEAARSFSRVVSLSSHAGLAIGNLFYARRNCCDWSDYQDLAHRLLMAVKHDELVDSPLSFLGVTDSPALQLGCARAFVTARYPGQTAAVRLFESRAHNRIRIAYLSGDFGEHAVSYLLAGVIEHHDATRFDTIGVSWGRGNGPTRLRLQKAFGQFIDATDLSDADITEQLRALSIDIAVDLSGHTGAPRTSIFTSRVAPIQINYLGFPATTGVTAMDYIVADEFVIPVEQQRHYSERVIYLPYCFQANDNCRAVEGSAPTRNEMDLPEKAFVWCSFNSSFKITPLMFDVWARLVNAIPGSVLWLVSTNSSVELNLRREARSRGLDPQRLKFASQAPYKLHLARIGLADLCLDTLPFNGGATTSDMLWAGVPVVTCVGQSFASRMSGSLLHSLGMPELITHTLPEYEQVALKLAQDPARLSALRDKLAQQKNCCRLFDTARFCGQLEGMYSALIARNAQSAVP